MELQVLKRCVASKQPPGKVEITAPGASDRFTYKGYLL